MLLLVDCSSCQTPLHLPPGATRIRCAVCQAFTLIARDPRLQSHAPASALPFPSSSLVTLAPSPFVFPPPAPSPFNHAPPGPPPAVHGQKRAVIVGISYKNSKDELNGCINDAKCMKFMLMNRFKFPESCILMLTEEEVDSIRWPTKDNITRAMQWLVLGCKPGDSLVFHFSGHGDNQKNESGDEIDGFDEVLLPVDHLTSGVIVDDEINAIMVRPLPFGVKLHAIVDACHSGTVLDLPYLCRMDRLGNFEWEDHRPPSGTWKGTSGGEVFSFTGCDDDQTSADTPQLSGSVWTGAMTFAFIQAIERGHGTTYGSLFNAMRSTVHEIFDKTKGRELVLIEEDDLNTLLNLLILNGASTEEGNQPPKKTQEPQLSSNEAFAVYEKLFSL